MFKYLLSLGALCLSLSAHAGLPPTTSKVIGDTNNVTTFNYQFPFFAGTHTGITVSLGVLSPAGGGTGAGSAFTLGSVIFAGASGVYTQDNANFFYDATNHRLGLGLTNPDSKLTLSNNAASLQAPPTNTIAHLAGATGSSVRELIDGYAGDPSLTMRRADTSATAPSAVQPDDILGVFSFYGYGSTGYSSSSRAQIGAAASAAWTDTSQDTYLMFKTTPNASVTQTERMRILSTGMVGIGTTTPLSRLVVSDNTAAPQAPITGAGFQLAGADGVQTRLLVDAYGNTPSMNYRRADGTAAAPTAVQSGESLGGMNAFGYGTTGYSASARTAANFFAAENWSDTAQGALFRISSTPIGSIAPVNRVTVDSTGFVGIGTTGPTALLNLAGSFSASSWGTAGIDFRTQAATYTDSSSSGTVANNYVDAIGIPTLAASAPTTYTTAATFGIFGAPIAGSNVTLTSSLGFVVAGNAGSAFQGMSIFGTIGTPTALITIAGNQSAASWGANGIAFRQNPNTFTDTSSSGTVTSNNIDHIAQPTIAASAPTTYTTASTFEIDNAPAAGSNVTLTKAYALNVVAGNSFFGGNVGVGTPVAPTADLQIKAGTATAGTAPLKFTLGTNLTAAEAGAVEYDGTNLYFTNSVPTRNTIMINPMTTGGDIIYGGASGVPTRLANGSAGQVLTSAGTTAAPTWASASSTLNQSDELINVGFATSVAANALTVALKQADGSTDPAAGTGAVKIGYRNATITTGGFSEVSTTAALSLTVPSGATLGMANATPMWVYVYAINNAGATELAVSSALYDDGSVVTTTALSGSSNSYNVIYSTTARTNVPLRRLGRIKITESTAGTWASNATELSLIPSQFGGVVSNYIGGQRIESALVNISGASACSVTSQSGNWISSTSASSSICTLTLISGMFSATPVCTASNNSTANARFVSVVGTSATSVGVVVYNSGGTAQNEAFNIICMGPR